MATEKYTNDYKLIDGNRIVRGHTTEFVLEEFLVAGLEKIKVLLMHIPLTEVQADTFLDCLIDEHFAFGGDMKGFEDFVERIGCFLDYYLDRLPKSVQITDQEALSDMEKNFGSLAETGNGESVLEEWPF